MYCGHTLISALHIKKIKLTLNCAFIHLYSVCICLGVYTHVYPCGAWEFPTHSEFSLHMHMPYILQGNTLSMISCLHSLHIEESSFYINL